MIRRVTVLIFAACGFLEAQSPTLKTLHTFIEVPDGAYPQYTLVAGNGGVLFGTTWGGGINCGGFGGCGTVFALSPPASAGGTWTEGIVYRFPGGSNGENPLGGVVIDKNGVLYGTAHGGSSGMGVVYSLTPPVSPPGEWTQTVLYNFTGGPDGDYPGGGVVIGQGGVLYGLTLFGGDHNLGTAYSLTPPATPGGSWAKTTIHSFGGSGDAASPKTGLAFGPAGVLFGCALASRTGAGGAVFSLTPPVPPGAIWTEQVLYSFSGGSDGATPVGPLAIGSGSVIYGATSYGGSAPGPMGWGTVFSLTPPSSPGGVWTEAVLHTFRGNGDGELPLAGVAIGKGGVLYGTTQFGGIAGGTSGYGTVFSLTPPTSPGGTWTESISYAFTGKHDGGMPSGGLVIGGGGVLYGSTMLDGQGWGTIFSLAP